MPNHGPLRRILSPRDRGGHIPRRRDHVSDSIASPTRNVEFGGTLGCYTRPKIQSSGVERVLASIQECDAYVSSSNRISYIGRSARVSVFDMPYASASVALHRDE